MKRSFISLIFLSIQITAQEKDSLSLSSSLTDSLSLSEKKQMIYSIDDVVITGTLKAVRKSQSPVPVEVYSQQFFKKNPTPNIFESVAMINGVKPQLNCSVCNTGDIHINGLEGPYTMILIDGMPIVSSLSTVYGLSGIPNALVDRIEVVKGPASSLYGSEAMGGIINIITKNALDAPLLSADLTSGSQGDVNVDLSTKFKINDKVASLLSLNYFNFSKRWDDNKDNFTDTALQDRISIFNKWNFKRQDNRLGSFALRYYYEDRFGGEMNWNKNYRGSDEVYGESIFTNRIEAFGVYQLPIKETIITQFSYNFHDQNSYYGENPFLAQQEVFFSQAYWEKTLGKHQLILGASFKNSYYDDNTPGTADELGNNQPMRSPLIGVFVQDQWEISKANTLLLGYRFDYDKIHHSIHSPRLAWKFAPNPLHTFRLSFGTGFRVVNLFTEDHAALTGSREVVVAHNLQPEKSVNSNFNYILKAPIGESIFNFDFSAFYSYFSNKIVGDFDTDPNKIIYDNLEGYAISKGASLNFDIAWSSPLKLMLGVTYLDVYQMYDREGITEKSQQLHAPKWSGTYNISYNFPKKWTLDFTGQFYGPMRLPVLENDFRPDYSPWFTLANIQVSKKLSNGFEIYGGVKNLFNFVPKNPIMRPFDPFDKDVDNPNNPNGYTFDTTYGYAPMQGIRSFLGVRWTLK
ncbi:TonB-dependent receptor plug domain-containing protein [Chryseobacterium sp. T1]